VLASSEESGSMWQTIPREFNWQMSSVVGVVFYALAAWVLQVTWPALRGADRRRWRWTRSVLWVLSVPYLVACIAGGIWFEAMRLLLPILLCDHVLRRALATMPPWTVKLPTSTPS
jgi:hypothetical protein